MAIIDYTLMHLIPTSGLLWWHLYDPDTSTDGYIADASGNGMHLSQVTTPPELQFGVRNGKPGWYFSGTSNPLVSPAGSFTAKHVFSVSSHEDAVFSTNRGLLSGIGASGGNWLTSKTTGLSRFYSFAAGYDYRMSDTEYADGNMVAPMSGTPQLIEVQNSTGVAMDGVQIGQQLNDTSRKWKGWHHEDWGYDRILTTNERRRIMLYNNIKYATWAQGTPLYFPDETLLTDTEILCRTRFDDDEPDFDSITDRWRYEDGNEDFNEVAPTAPQEWEYEFKIVGQTIPQTYAYREIFDGFFRQARVANPFYFRDKWGEVWSNVRIKNYKSSHEGHKSYEQNIAFRLRTNTGTVVTADSASGEYIIDGGGA